MVWFIVVILLRFNGTSDSHELQARYGTFTECETAKERIVEAVEPYWPNAEAKVKRIEVICRYERPHGN